MKVDRTSPEAAVVIRWPQSTPIAVAREASKRLVEGRVPATWSVDQASQVDAIASWGAVRNGCDAALIVPAAAGASTPATEQAATREVGRRLELLRTTGQVVQVVHGGAELSNGHWPRTLRALGVQAVVADGAAAPGSARALPFGVWHFAPQASAPRARHWTNWFRLGKLSIFGRLKSSPAVVTIDLARVGDLGSAGWRGLGAVLAEASEARSSGAIRLVTMGELAARFTQSNAPRPQRSILRTAAQLRIANAGNGGAPGGA